jgi:hypothetical protein
MTEIAMIGMNVSEVSSLGSASAHRAMNTTTATIVAINQPNVLAFSRMKLNCSSQSEFSQIPHREWIVGHPDISPAAGISTAGRRA